MATAKGLKPMSETRLRACCMTRFMSTPEWPSSSAMLPARAVGYLRRHLNSALYKVAWWRTSFAAYTRNAHDSLRCSAVEAMQEAERRKTARWVQDAQDW
ncbi:hypothetical protein AAI_09551 [Pseudomonas viridiflava UASWS0038]|nr:hypothetical protein AAI_09551 [Pseudomonas viridiflava UASWS0038]